MRYFVQVQGQQVGVERVWSKRPRLFLDGEPVASDQQGRHMLTLPDGAQHQARVRFGAGVLNPYLEVAGQRYPIGGQLGRPVVVALALYVALGLLGGGMGVLLAVLGAGVAARLLISPRRGPGHVVAAVGALVGAAALYAVLATLIALLF